MTSYRKQLRLVSIKVPSSLDAKISRLAKRKRTTRSAIVREALEAYEGGARASVGDLLSDLCGSLQGGPRDLSTNPKHLRGYGR